MNFKSLLNKLTNTTGIVKLLIIFVCVIVVLISVDYLFFNGEYLKLVVPETFQSSSKVRGFDPMEKPGAALDMMPPVNTSAASANVSSGMGEMEGASVDHEMESFSSTVQGSSCYPSDRLTSEDLIPNDTASSMWADAHPTGEGNLSNKNFLQAGHHFGVDTVGQSLRNANLQLRSDPVIPKTNPWPIMQSTIEADTNRRPFEIGNC